MQTFVKSSLYKITKKTVTSKSVLKLNSVAGGGFAISILAQ
ncbi:alpha-glucosidase [Prevotella sp. CAG:520]|nr:alpha-glucosidase [Prevotella sp. CAG:520]